MTPPDGSPRQPAVVPAEEDLPTVRRLAGEVLGTDPTVISEIGNGNLNQVFRASSARDSVVIKRAVPYVHSVGRSWPLSSARVITEARAYEVHHAASPGRLPGLRGRDDDARLLAIEDIAGLDCRSWLSSDRPAPSIATAVGDYCADIVQRTSPGAMSGARWDELRAAFTDTTMRDFTDRVVFRAPFEDDPTNSWPAHLRERRSLVTDDPAILRTAAHARAVFLGRADCLLHGDLHSGSVLFDGTRTAIIDLEFAFFGPAAFDIGNFLAHLYFARARRHALGESAARRAEIDQLATEFCETVTRRLAGSGAPTGLAAEAALFAGSELLRRIVGRFAVADLVELPTAARESAERAVFSAWHNLFRSHHTVTTFTEIWHTAEGTR
ncbi:S-methyl-5-thioribose kinase [Amycolatopsis endophytica]|uniref:5-methylthioribose kinase n=1 Tax=Amycolatopsis endophytica TaxID=860233 RepID=A0A853BDL7_9PSEU|nr:phosphotransferase [Amycolatopsis endophytica]NYI92751.1 5-methylthioribose kinase [Amycolatopsis endophytica]